MMVCAEASSQKCISCHLGLIYTRHAIVKGWGGGGGDGSFFFRLVRSSSSFYLIYILILHAFLSSICAERFPQCSLVPYSGVLSSEELSIWPVLFMPYFNILKYFILQTLDALKMLCPKRALLIGMTHEFDHHKDNELLVEWSRR